MALHTSLANICCLIMYCRAEQHASHGEKGDKREREKLWTMCWDTIKVSRSDHASLVVHHACEEQILTSTEPPTQLCYWQPLGIILLDLITIVFMTSQKDATLIKLLQKIASWPELSLQFKKNLLWNFLWTSTNNKRNLSLEHFSC